jgi:hypothetical protein
VQEIKVLYKIPQIWNDKNLTRDQEIGAVAGHEWEHATNPVDVAALKNNEDISRNDPRHKPASDVGKKISNKSKSPKK